MNPTVVILLSDKRSGSTMLEREVCRHAGARHVEYCPHTFHETHHWLKAAVVLDQPAAMFSGGRVYQGYGSRATARAYLVDTVCGNVPGFQVPADERDLVHEGWEAMCHRFAQPVFFEKSPQYLAHWAALSLILNWSRQTTYSVKFIGLVRNPLAVMASAQRLFGTAPESRQFGWLDIYRNLLSLRAMVPAEDFLMVRYEDIIADGPAALACVQRFIGLEPDPAIGAEVHGESANKWRGDPAFVLQLHLAVRQMAEHLGYDGDSLVNPRKGPGGQVGPGRWSRWRRAAVDRWIKPRLLPHRAATK